MFLSSEPPVFTNKPPSQVLPVRGSILSLCCEATGSPRPRIEWLRTQQPSYLPLTFRQENGCLEVSTTGDENYICRATNQFGRAETATAIIMSINLKGSMFCIFDISYPYVDCIPATMSSNVLHFGAFF